MNQIQFSGIRGAWVGDWVGENFFKIPNTSRVVGVGGWVPSPGYKIPPTVYTTIFFGEKKFVFTSNLF